MGGWVRSHFGSSHSFRVPGYGDRPCLGCVMESSDCEAWLEAAFWVISRAQMSLREQRLDRLPSPLPELVPPVHQFNPAGVQGRVRLLQVGLGVACALGGWAGRRWASGQASSKVGHLRHHQRPGPLSEVGPSEGGLGWVGGLTRDRARHRPTDPCPCQPRGNPPATFLPLAPNQTPGSHSWAIPSRVPTRLGPATLPQPFPWFVTPSGPPAAVVTRRRCGPVRCQPTVGHSGFGRLGWLAVAR